MVPHQTQRRSERRQYPRAKFSWRAAIGFRDEQDLVTATTRDISLGGICVRGNLAAVPGDEMLVLVSLKDRIVPALATVVRSEILGPEEVQLHLKFNWFSDFGRDKLARLTRVTLLDLSDETLSDEDVSDEQASGDDAADGDGDTPPVAPNGVRDAEADVPIGLSVLRPVRDVDFDEFDVDADPRFPSGSED